MLTCEALEDVSICYDSTVHNSLGDILQFVYVWMARNQAAKDSYHMSDRAFYDKFCADVISTEDENTGFREGVLQVGLDVSMLELQHELDREWEQLFEDCGVMMERPKTTLLKSQGRVTRSLNGHSKPMAST